MRPLSAYKAILSDLDGCLVAGDRVLPGAPRLFAEFGERLWIVSNNSSDTPESLSARLARLGLATDASRIVLAGASALESIAAGRPGARVALYAAETLTRHAADLRLVADHGAPELVFLARDPGFSYVRLTRLLQQLHSGAALVVANTDGAHPGADGAPVPETGALLAAVQAACPGVRYTAFGKPDPWLFNEALKRAGVAPEDALFIGDNPATDGAGARGAGMEFARVVSADGVAPLLAAR